MLSPEALEEAGEALARVYRGIEADMLDYLVDLMLSGAGVTSRSVTAAALLGQTHADELRRIIERHAGEVDAELRATVEKFMRASDADDMERLGRPGTERAWPRQMDATVRGLAAILQRDNLHMEQGALDAFLSASTEAIARVNSGSATAEQALHRAVRRLERDGVSVVQYRDAAGNLTVRNRVDVAVRRHVRTQIAQDGARMTARAMDEYGVQLVEVSSHPNARPSHAAWQGQVYGWRGAVSIDGRSYEGLEAATGYGSVDGLLGANCRHSFGPYLPGAPRAYERDPKHASGLPGEEVYKLEQRQRAGERAIREAKRELAGARKCYDVSPTNAARVEVVRAQDLLARRQEAMRQLVKESNAKSLTGHPVLHRHPAREWAGDMPGGAWVKSSGRTLAQLMDGKAAREAMARAGASRTAVTRAVAEEMKLQGMKASDFSTLTAGEQRRVFGGVLNAGAVRGTRVADCEERATLAEKYYAKVRRMDEAEAVGKIAEATGMSAAESRQAFRHLIVEEHDLVGGHRHFDPDYQMAETMRRLFDGEELHAHDVMMFKHELLESRYMAQGMDQQAAHGAANLRYNYEDALDAWLDEEEWPKDARI